MAEIAALAPEFSAAGWNLAALSVDSPRRSAALHARLQLPFPLLCDPERVTVRSWDLYNSGERGGIARPATVVLDPQTRVVFWETEAMAARIRPAELLAYLQSAAPLPAARRFWPGWRSFFRALRS